MAPVQDNDMRACAHENHHNPEVEGFVLGRFTQSHDPLFEARWHKNYELLVEFINRNGHCRVTRSIDKGLAEWMTDQRTYRRKGVLREDRIFKLNAIGFKWDVRKSIWQDKYLLLIEFIKENGHCHPVRSTALGRWAAAQIVSYKKGVLSEDKVKKMNDIGFEWERQTSREQLIWDEHYEKLLEFRKIHGHCRVKVSDESIGHWLRNERMKYRNGLLSEDRKQKLNDVGVEWEVVSNCWQYHYDLLQEFKDKYGHCRVTKRIDKSLAIWVHNLRYADKKGLVTEDRKQKLNDLGFEWELKKMKSSWQDRYERLLEFKNKNGHCQIPREVDKDLSIWVHLQIGKYKKGLLTEARKQKLNDIGFEWKVRKITWQDNYEHLLEFKKKNGHCRVTKEFDKSLSIWVYRQRANYKKGRHLTEDQKQKLNDIGFDWQVHANKVAASDNGSQRLDDNHLPQQQQTATAMTATGALKHPFLSIQPFVERDAGNGDSNICEEFKEAVTYGDSEDWV